MVFCLVLFVAASLFEFYRPQSAEGAPRELKDIQAQLQAAQSELQKANSRLSDLAWEAELLDTAIQTKLKFNLEKPDSERDEINLKGVIEDVAERSAKVLRMARTR
jgi:hypothetical protein